MSCSPLVFGPYSQTLFLGCSVVDFSCSLGWNEQVSQMTVNLVRDTCTKPAGSGAVCYDLDTKSALGLDLTLEEVTTYAADPGFTEPSPGDPVYFRMGPNFEFCGIVQSWSRNNSDSSNPTYSVTLNDPREVLSECHLVLDQYVGGMVNSSNVFNVYGYCEQFGQSCPEAFLTDFTGPGAFGGSKITSQGISWNRIKRSARILTGALPKYQSSWSPYGRIRFMGHEYLLDWSELPYISYYRIPAGSMSILDVISMIANDAGLDYYIELIFCVDQASPTTIHNVIKVRTVSRVNQPVMGQIEEFIGDGEGTNSAQYGQELRNENTSSILVGGNRMGIVQVASNHEIIADETNLAYYNRWDLATIWPYWGKHADGGVIIGQGLNQDHHFTIDLRHLNIISEDGKRRISGYTIYVDELHAALAGKDTWLSYFIEHHDDVVSIIGKGINPLEFLNLTLNEVHVAQNGDAFMPHDVINFRKKNIQKRISWQDVQTSLIQIEKLFRIVERYATQFYGQKFMVRLWDVSANRSYVCVNEDVDSGQLVYSREITDAGWTDAEAGVFGIVNPVDLDVFRLEDRRITAICRFNEAGRLIIPDIDPGDFVFQDLISDANGNPNQDAVQSIGTIYGQQLFTKCEIDPEYVYISDGFGNWNINDPRAIVTLPSIFHQRIEEDVDNPFFVGFIFNEVGKNNREWAQAGKAERQRILRNMLTRAGSTSVHYGYDNLRILPNAVNIPLKSNVETYGPWFAYGAVGKTRYEKNDDLTPWNYGNSTNLSLAATNLARYEVTNMQVGEFGSVEVPGLPALHLGAELRSGAASLNVLRDIILANDNDDLGNNNVVELALTQWNGSFGPNITDIQVSVGRNGITTRYGMRTFTPSFGRFAKQNAERLKINGLLANKKKSENRERLLGKTKDTVQSFSRDISNQLMRERQNLTGFFARTPHQVLVGQQVPYSGSNGQTFYRTYVHTQSLAEATNEMADYENKHLMSLDGLLKPFSISEFRYHRKYSKPNFNAANYRYSPPVVAPGSKNNYHNMPIDAGTLNPFLNPDVVDPKYPLSTNSGCGHGIEYIARDVEPPEDMCVHHDNEYALDRNDYRGICLQGPIILKSWGYDTYGKPVPNSLQTDTDQYYNLGGQGEDKFLDNWLKRPDTWKTGPIDLRWDYIRGVWTAFPGFQNVYVTLCEPVTYGEFTNGFVQLNSSNYIQDRNGELPLESCCDTDAQGVVEFYNSSRDIFYAGETVLCAYVNNRYEPIGNNNRLYAIQVLSDKPGTPLGGHASGTTTDYPTHPCNPKFVTVDVGGVPVHKGDIIWTYPLTPDHHIAVRMKHYPLAVMTDIDCVEISGPFGVTRALSPCTRVIWVEGGYATEECVYSEDYNGVCTFTLDESSTCGT